MTLTKSFSFSLFLLLALSGLSACQQQYLIVSIEGEPLPVDSTYDRMSSGNASEILAPFKQKVDSMMNRKLGEAAVDMDRGRPEMPLSNLVADVLREAAREVVGRPADVAVINLGGIRSSLSKGAITVGDIYEILPFENSLCVLTFKGKVLEQVLREIALRNGEGLSGVKMTIGKNRSLQSVTVGGEPIRPEADYIVATVDYLAEGNDGMPSLAQYTDRICPEGKMLRSLFMAYVEEQTRKGKKIEARKEGRVVNTEEVLEMGMMSVAPQQVQLTMLHTSDTHSRLEPIAPWAADRSAGLGGTVRRVALVDSLRQLDDELLLLDCGDISQGTPYYNMFRGEAEIRMMNRMGYDAMVIGNHEFDFGQENMARLFRMAQFPVLCANYSFEGTVLEEVVKPYIVLERKGIRIGLFGLSPALKGLVQEDKYEGIVYHNPIEVAQRMADTLRNEEHCDVVVCLSHLGLLGINQREVEDEQLMAGTEGIDLILGGHSHTYMEQPKTYLNKAGKPVVIFHSGSRGTTVGKVTVTLEPR